MKPGRIDQGAEDAIRRFLSRIADRYDLAGDVLHGCRARGTHRDDSDADLAVLLEGDRGKAPQYTPFPGELDNTKRRSNCIACDPPSS